jgi:hypothetical protein
LKDYLKVHRNGVLRAFECQIVSSEGSRRSAGAAIAKAMGFPPALWFEEELSGGARGGGAGASGGLAGRVERLFEVIKDPKTGETYTSARIARMSLGDLTEDDVLGIRAGALTDPPLNHLLALARAFGVEPSYLVDGTGEATLDREIVEALRDDTTRAIARESARLPERERRLVLGIVRQLEGARSPDGAGRGASSEDR